MLAHEVLDALPVERLVFRQNKLMRQGLTLVNDRSESLLTFAELPLSSSLINSLKDISDCIGLHIPPRNVPDGWNTEWHTDLYPWFKKAGNAMIKGQLLIIDYVLEASRYYSSSRLAGTIITYEKQKASGELLSNPGKCDITSHLCLETLNYFAQENGWNLLGETRQGQALLALGLSERLHSLQKLPAEKLSIALQRRESLLRLVDPAGLGEFRWIAFEINKKITQSQISFRSRFLEDPII